MEGQASRIVPVACKSRLPCLCTALQCMTKEGQTEHSMEWNSYQASDDFDGRLIASIPASTNQHCQKHGHYKVLLQELLVLLKDKR